MFDSDGGSGTFPHGFDREVLPAIPALWYVLHLPRIALEAADLPLAAIDFLGRTRLRHEILLAPIEALESAVLDPPAVLIPTLLIAPDDSLPRAHVLASTLGYRLGACGTSQLSQALLETQWQEIHRLLVPTLDYVGQAPTMSTRLDFSGLTIPVQRLAAQLDARTALPGPESNAVAWIEMARRQHAFVRAGARAEFDGTGEDGLADACGHEASSLRLPVAMGVPGVAAPYRRIARSRTTGAPPNHVALDRADPADTFDTDMEARADHLVERSAIEWMVARDAACDGIGVITPEISSEMFSAFADIENHWSSGPKPATVRRLLDRLDKLAAPMWTQEVLAAIRTASRLTVFSNFPLGVLRLPGDSAPLACRLPVAYRPLTPLTRAVQLETLRGSVDLSAGCRVLIAECIPSTDPVGRLSRAAWDTASEMFASESDHRSSMTRADIDSPVQLREAIADAQANILILSAHGFSEAGAAGVIIGGTPCLGPELGDLPPVVILSACHVSPRGRGAVAIADLLLRQGAIAILGTHVPVDVRHNAQLVVRLLVYVMQSIAGHEDHETLVDAWRHTQSTQAVLDALYGNARLSEWGGSTTPGGLPVLREFMTNASVGRLRPNHIFNDTEAVLIEIAQTMGQGEEIRTWLKTPGYVPESAFYALAGDPEGVRLRKPSMPPHLSTPQSAAGGIGTPTRRT